MPDDNTTADPADAVREAVSAGKALGRIDARYAAIGIARRHMREAEANRDEALRDGNTHAALIYARQAQTADAIAREIDGVANDR